MTKTMKRKTTAAGMALALVAGLFGFGQDAYAKNILSCNVVVVGGGAAGVHTTYQLAKLPKSNPDSRVCVFEKEDRLGGRIHTVVQVWPAAWYWLKGGSIYTNADIAAWAAQPLVGENIALASESYNPQRSGWSDGACKSSINALNMLFDTDLTAEPVNLRLNLLRAMPVTGRRQGLPR